MNVRTNVFGDQYNVLITNPPTVSVTTSSSVIQELVKIIDEITAGKKNISDFDTFLTSLNREQLNTVDEDGNTILHLVCLKTNKWNIKLMLTFMNMLISNNIDINARNFQGLTPLHCVCASKTAVPRLITLIQDDSRVDIVDNNGNTPIHTLCSNCDFPPTHIKIITEKLIKKSITKGFNKLNNQGKTALDLACAFRLYSVAELLIDNNATLSQGTLKGSKNWHESRNGPYRRILNSCIVKLTNYCTTNPQNVLPSAPNGIMNRPLISSTALVQTTLPPIAPRKAQHLLNRSYNDIPASSTGNSQTSQTTTSQTTTSSLHAIPPPITLPPLRVAPPPPQDETMIDDECRERNPYLFRITAPITSRPAVQPPTFMQPEQASISSTSLAQTTPSPTPALEQYLIDNFYNLNPVSSISNTQTTTSTKTRPLLTVPPPKMPPPFSQAIDPEEDVSEAMTDDDEVYIAQVVPLSLTLPTNEKDEKN